MKKLTLQTLKDMEPDTIFATGTLVDSPEEFHLARTGNEVRWVATRGYIHDWAIYSQNPHDGNMVKSFDEVKQYGDKISNEAYIKKLVPCDDEAFGMYRY